jgi:hypothetical protein
MWPIPMQVLTLLVKASVFGRPACARRIKDMVPMRLLLALAVTHEGARETHFGDSRPQTLQCLD